ncbi:MAG: hypothetical protein WC260_00050 [Candidatus Pacearchaeota archaeon]
MVIKEEKALTITEVIDLVEKSSKEYEIKNFLKQFNKNTLEDVKNMKEELKNLEILKLKEIHITKIIDFKPTEVSELNKIISDVSLDNDEITKIIDVIKKY